MIKSKTDFLTYKAKIDENKAIKKTEILVGMSSCGIAAGAKDVMTQFEKILKSKNIQNIDVKQCGCVGFCYTEPTVEIKKPDGAVLLLGPVNENDVQNIIDMHVLNNLTESKYVIPTNFKNCFE